MEDRKLHWPSPSMAVALLALFLSLAGTGIAASRNSVTGQKKPKGLAKVKEKQGPTGPTGPMGARGAPGSNGPEGEDGAQGVAGAVGPTGEIGPPGEAGPTGATGATGTNGVTGATGATGEKGATGATGPEGKEGKTYANRVVIPNELPGHETSPTTILEVPGVVKINTLQCPTPESNNQPTTEAKEQLTSLGSGTDLFVWESGTATTDRYVPSSWTHYSTPAGEPHVGLQSKEARFHITGGTGSGSFIAAITTLTNVASGTGCVFAATADVYKG